MLCNRIKILFKTILIQVVLWPMFILTGCGSHEDMFSSPDLEAGEKRKVTLDLRVEVLENLASGDITKAFNPNDDGDFEEPVSQFEGLHTLRVVIVRNSGSRAGIIECNRMVVLDAENGAILGDNLLFKVDGGEEKKIYLLGNEAAVNYNFNTLLVNSVFPEQAISDIQISRLNGSSVIDNTAGNTPIYVPMSECFKIDVPEPKDESTYLQETLFVTRSLIKFSFCFITDEDYSASGVTVTGLRITNLANSCYYLPRCEYSPVKDVESMNPYGGREITQFTMPPTTYSNYNYSFVIDPPELKGGLNQVLAPAVYLPESKCQDGTSAYGVSIILSGPGATWFNPEDLTIKDIPRNTHVKVNIRIKNGVELKPEVQLLPYTGVYLNPQFGL